MYEKHEVLYHIRTAEDEAEIVENLLGDHAGNIYKAVRRSNSQSVNRVQNTAVYVTSINA